MKSSALSDCETDRCPLNPVLDRYRELVAEHERKAAIDQRIIEIMSGEIERLARLAETRNGKP